MNLDILIFAAHPDDAELGMGGTIAKLIRQNKKVGIIDLTEGELGTRGTKETRKEEAAEAGKVLNITLRENLAIEDGNVQVNKENTNKLIQQIRKYKPKVIFGPYFHDRHPDHIEASKLVKRAMFLSGLTKIKTTLDSVEQESFRPKKLFYYMLTYEYEPTFVVDISDTFQTKMESVKAFKTQFHVEGVTIFDPSTYISNPEFMKFQEARAKSFGFKIKKEYGEAFYSEELIELNISNHIDELP